MDPNEENEVPLNNDLERRIAETFEVFDHASNKQVDIREIATIVRALGCCPTDAEIQEILVKIEDPAFPGHVHLRNFLPIMSEIITEHKYQPASPEELLEAFHVLDAEGVGYITKDHITTLMTQDGEPFTQDEVEEMLEIAIDPHTETVPYEYYINQLMWEPEGEADIYKLAERIERDKPPPPPTTTRRFSEFLQTLNQFN